MPEKPVRLQFQGNLSDVLRLSPEMVSMLGWRDYVERVPIDRDWENIQAGHDKLSRELREGKQTNYGRCGAD